MMEKIIELDRAITLAVNGAHTPCWDAVMHFLSAVKVWIPLYLLLAAALFILPVYGKKSAVHEYPHCSGWIVGAIGLASLLLCFGLCDQLSNVVKDAVQRLRPGHEPALSGMLHLVDGKGGLYGFVSAHAANTFGLALLSSLILRRKFYTAFIFVWAALISFSRIYLARHYMTDVLCGALEGILIAAILYFLWKYILKSIEKNKSRKCSVS